MRIIKPSRIREYGHSHPDAASALSAWLLVAKQARWQSLQDVRLTYPNADGVKVRSGEVVTLFNIGGNKYRLVVSIKFHYGIAYVLRLLTHAEYDENLWKGQL